MVRMIPRYLVDFDLDRLGKEEYDLVVVGSGIAGLYTALKARDLGSILVLTKRKLEDSNTEYAQGGIAAAVGPADSPDLHFADTLAAGDGLCDPGAVRVLVDEGPECVLDLARLGARFDMDGDDFELTREGAHSERRILHARGDATGDEVRRALEIKVLRDPRIRMLEQHFTVDLLTDGGRCAGVLALDPDGRLRAYLGKATVLATGGTGQLYRNSTNPEVATGDGIAMAYRAGAKIKDIEFVQFHPTALYHPGSPKFLISEAVRGEGAILLNTRGERFMPAYHERAELAPRDVVARAIADQMVRTGSPYVLLDPRVMGEERFRHRFPTILEKCREYGIDPLTRPIPVAPAAHYLMGGIKTDVDGRTDIPGLFACGETACTGIHGANRLASNSLLEGLVFGRRIARAVGADLKRTMPEAHVRFETRRPTGPLPVENAGDSGETDARGSDSAEVDAAWREVQEVMWRDVGISRDGRGLDEAAARLEEIREAVPRSGAPRGELELANLATVALLVATAAKARTESRGGHFRSDFPARDDRGWLRHIILGSGELTTEEAPS